MRVMVIGARGLLGTDMVAEARKAGHDVIESTRDHPKTPIDVTILESVVSGVRSSYPDLVINCAAYTDVDGAESNREIAFQVNALGPSNLAAACSELDIPLVTLSTDFVFDGEKAEPYSELDFPGPLGVYGESKIAGEQLVRERWHKSYIVRTSWLFGAQGKCFPTTILNAARTRSHLQVVADQRGCPTYTVDLARAILAIADTGRYGTFHVSNSGVTTWFEFACKALEYAGIRGCTVEPITSAEWPTPVRRPANSSLDGLMLRTLGLPPLRSWEEALKEFLEPGEPLEKTEVADN